MASFAFHALFAVAEIIFIQSSCSKIHLSLLHFLFNAQFKHHIIRAEQTLVIYGISSKQYSEEGKFYDRIFVVIIPT